MIADSPTILVFKIKGFYEFKNNVWDQIYLIDWSNLYEMWNNANMHRVSVQNPHSTPTVFRFILFKPNSELHNDAILDLV